MVNNVQTKNKKQTHSSSADVLLFRFRASLRIFYSILVVSIAVDVYGFYIIMCLLRDCPRRFYVSLLEIEDVIQK